MFQVPPLSRTQNSPVIGLLLQQLRKGGFLVSDDTGKLRRNQESGMAAGNLFQLDYIIRSIVFLHTLQLPSSLALKHLGFIPIWWCVSVIPALVSGNRASGIESHKTSSRLAWVMRVSVSKNIIDTNYIQFVVRFQWVFISL